MELLWFIVSTLLLMANTSHSFGEKFNSYDNTAPDEGLTDAEIVPNSYVLPEQIFNDGKPFYLEKDPVSGVLDFNLKKSSGIVALPNEIDPQSDKDISLNTNSIQPNFHDFLNLPVKYSSSKFVYPLVSSSYANLKYQGNNKNYISNHKNYSTTTTTSPKYYTTPPRGLVYDGEKKSPIMTTTTTTTSTTTTTEPTTTPLPNTVNPSTAKPIYTRPPQKYTTTKYKYSTIRKRPLPISTTLAPAQFSARPTDASTQHFDASLSTSTTTEPLSTATSLPKENPTTPFKPLPPAATFTTKSPGDVYSSMAHKKDPDSMSLSDLFNSLLGDDDMSAESTTLPPATSTPATVRSTTETVSIDIETRRPMLYNGSFADVYTEPSNANDYVKFNVQQPNANMIQFKPVPSMNNIIISPNQNSATFVLGSQQTVGPGVFVGTAEKESFYQQPDNQQPQPVSNANQYQYGHIFNDMSMPALKPQGFTQQQPPQLQHQAPPPAINVGLDSMKKETDGVVRFPSNVNFDNAPVVTGTFSNDIHLPNGHGSPIALPQNGNNLVIFPPNSQSVETTVGAQHQTVGSDYLDKNSNVVSFSIDSSNKFHQLQPPNENGVNANFNAINNMNDNVQLQSNTYQGASNREPVPAPVSPAGGQQLPQAVGSIDQSTFGQLSHGLMPPHDDHGRRPQFTDRNHIRQGVAAPGRQPPFNRNEFTRKPLDGLHRPPTNNGDRPLPNILPQFRPNAKIGSGQNANREAPNRGSQKFGFRQPQVSQQRIQQVDHQMTRQRPPGSSPPHFRRVPPPTYSPTSFNAKMAPAAPSAEQIDASRRYYQIRQSIANDRVFGPGPPPQSAPNRRYIDGYPSQRNADLGVLDNQPDTYLPVYQNGGEYTRNSPNMPQQQPQQQQQPVAEQLVQNQLEDRTGKLEPVVTLQMLQHLKQLQKDSNINGQLQTVVQSIRADAPVSVQTASDKPPVYVVYPVKTSPMKLDVLDNIGKDGDDPVVVGHRGEQPPLPPSDINAMSSTSGAGPNVYQNTPFTVIRQEQKPILMAKNKQSKVQFPYALEKPTTLIKALAAEKAKQSAPKYGFYDDSGKPYNIGEGPAGETVMSRVVTGNMAAYSGTHEIGGGEEEDAAAISTKLTR